MWNNREDGPATQPKREPRVYQGLPRNAAVIGETMHVVGDIRSVEEVYVAGKLDGSVETQSAVSVAPNGKVKANIKAREVTIHGTVLGSVVVTEKIVIHENGSLIGDIKAAGIVIEDGAYFKGNIDIIRATAPAEPLPPPPIPAAT